MDNTSGEKQKRHDCPQKIWTKEYDVDNPNERVNTRKQILDILKGGRIFLKVKRDIERITINGLIAVFMGSETEFLWRHGYTFEETI
ncbi:hypothetical protein FHW89_004583 [Mucilaginibacter sp. SG564]|nr:hypothetical protein [Mucilaginibacter sp. SG564]